MFTFKTQRDALLTPLQNVSGIVEKRHTLPILSNVFIEKRKDSLLFVATDIEIQITNSSMAQPDDDSFAVTVAARKFQDILRSLPENAELSLVFDDKKLLLRAGKSRFTLQTLPAEDFPRMAIDGGETARIVIAQKEFRSLLAQTQFAMAVQDVRYYLNGLYLLLDGNCLRAVATDGHRLSYASIELASEYEKIDLILPRKAVHELNRLLTDSDDELEIKMTSNQIMFSFGNITLVSKLIDGKFPDYERVIPEHLPNSLLINRSVLLSAMQRAAILTNEKFRGVRMIFSSGVLKILAANAEQEEAQEEIEIDYSGSEVDIGFNVSYILDVLNNSASETINWSFNDSNSSVLVTLPDNPGFKYVVMPMRI